MYADLGLLFCFETGQETAVTRRCTIEDVATDGREINLDPANLILDGKADSIDTLDGFGACVRGLHPNDGLFPRNGCEHGKQTPRGEGKVDFPARMGRLEKPGYGGAVTIERETCGPRKIEDIKLAMARLEPLRQAIYLIAAG